MIHLYLKVSEEFVSLILLDRFWVFIFKGFRTIVFIFIVISTTFRLICPPAFFRCLSNSGTYAELRSSSFIESTGVACSDSVSRDRVKVLNIPVLLLACCQHWTCNLQMIISLEYLTLVTGYYTREFLLVIFHRTLQVSEYFSWSQQRCSIDSSFDFQFFLFFLNLSRPFKEI